MEEYTYKLNNVFANTSTGNGYSPMYVTTAGTGDPINCVVKEDENQAKIERTVNAVIHAEAKRMAEMQLKELVDSINDLKQQEDYLKKGIDQFKKELIEINNILSKHANRICRFENLDI